MPFAMLQVNLVFNGNHREISVAGKSVFVVGEKNPQVKLVMYYTENYEKE